MTTTTQAAPTRPRALEAKKAAAKESKREARQEEARALLESGIEEIAADPERFADYLRFRARFHDYSFNNTLLIQMQRPGARHCMGYRRWQKNGHQVRKGERGLMIFVPYFRKATSADEAAEHGVDMGERYLAGFGTGHVFDISQTDEIDGYEEASGTAPLRYVDPLPEIQGDGYAEVIPILEAVAERRGFRVERFARGDGSDAERLAGTAQGFCEIGRIAYRIDRPANGQVKTLAHELAHALAHRERGDTWTHEEKELHAEGAAFMFCYMLGLDTSGYSLPYLKHYQSERHAVADHLQTIEDLGLGLWKVFEEQRETQRRREEARQREEAEGRKMPETLEEADAAAAALFDTFTI